MGVTEGWRDVYKGSLTFQWIDVSDLSPGNYRMAAESDPYDIVVETDETNNGIAVSDAISVVPGYIAQSQTVSLRGATPTLDVVLAATTFGNPGPRYFRIVTPPANGSLNVAVGDGVVGHDFASTHRTRGSPASTHSSTRPNDLYQRLPTDRGTWRQPQSAWGEPGADCVDRGRPGGLQAEGVVAVGSQWPTPHR